MNEKIHTVIQKNQIERNDQLDIFANQSIKKINFSLEKFRYNVIIAVFHEIYTFFSKLAEENKNYINLQENYKKVLITMLPIIPHIVSECLTKMDSLDEIKWPNIDDKYLQETTTNIVIQINGKKRSVVSLAKGLDENTVLKNIKDKKIIDKYLSGKKIFKTIYIQDRIINIIIK